tara:strand:- start:169 stop:360 length:192 start_codon:yes stop_codon:yes gene_type:complete
LIHTLLGQSEVLTASGAFLLTTEHQTLGMVMIGLGIFGAICRQSINLGFVNRQLEIQEDDLND